MNDKNSTLRSKLESLFSDLPELAQPATVPDAPSVVPSPDAAIEPDAAAALDAAEQRAAEVMTTLERLRHQTRLILDGAEEGIVGLDLQGRHTFVNAAAARMLGYAVEELIGKRSHPAWHHTRADGSPYPAEECHIYATLHTGVPCRMDAEVFWRKDGTSFPVEYSAAPLREGEQLTGAVVSFRDITERKRAEAERERLLQDIQTRAQRDQLINTMVARVRAGLTVEQVLTATVEEIGAALGAARVAVRLNPAGGNGRGHEER